MSGATCETLWNSVVPNEAAIHANGEISRAASPTPSVDEAKASVLEKPAHAHSHLHRINSRVRRRQAGI